MVIHRLAITMFGPGLEITARKIRLRACIRIGELSRDLEITDRGPSSTITSSIPLPSRTDRRQPKGRENEPMTDNEATPRELSQGIGVFYWSTFSRTPS